ncbi:nucleoid occlusion protein, partial [Striga asiatica]
FWDERIIQYKRYYVSGANVQPTNPLYQISDYAFTWTIQKGTLVEEYPEKLPPQLPCKIHLQEYDKLRIFTLGIEDNTGLIQAVISGPEAEQLLPMTATQMSLNKNQVTVEEQLTPTTHTVLASILDTPSPIAPEKQNIKGVKRSIDFDLQPSGTTNTEEIEGDDPVQGSASGRSTKRQKKHA